MCDWMKHFNPWIHIAIPEYVFRLRFKSRFDRRFGIALKQLSSYSKHIVWSSNSSAILWYAIQNEPWTNQMFFHFPVTAIYFCLERNNITRSQFHFVWHIAVCVAWILGRRLNVNPKVKRGWSPQFTRTYKFGSPELQFIFVLPSKVQHSCKYPSYPSSFSPSDLISTCE